MPRRASKLITVRSTRHGPLLSDVSAELSSVGANAEVPVDSPDRRQRVRRRPRLDRAHPTTDGETRCSVSTPRRTGGSSARRARCSPYPARTSCTPTRRQHRLPGARTSSPSARATATATTRRRAGCRRTTGRAATCRSTRCPACSTPPRASSSPPTRPSTGPDYRWHLTDSFDQGYRSQRIRDLLTASHQGRQSDSTSRDWRKMQLDTRNPMAPVLVPYLHAAAE